jgi:HAMP domain-containing protein
MLAVAAAVTITGNIDANFIRQVRATMVPIKNHDACYRCHDPGQKVNGILVFDLDVSPLRAAMNQDVRWMVAGSGALVFLLVGGIALLVRLLVVRRLQRVESTARRIVSGELEQRVQDEGSEHHLVSRAGIQHDGGLGDGPARRGPHAARTARNRHQQHRRRHSRAGQPAEGGRGQRRVPAADGAVS